MLEEAGCKRIGQTKIAKRRKIKINDYKRNKKSVNKTERKQMYVEEDRDSSVSIVTRLWA